MLKHVNELGVVDLQKHTSDLAGQVWVHALDQREDAFTQHLLLLLWGSSGQHGGGQRLLALDEYGRLGLSNLLLDHRLWHAHNLSWVSDIGSVLVVGWASALGSSHGSNSGHHGLRLHLGHGLWLHGWSWRRHDWHHLLSRHRPWHHLTHAWATWTGSTGELVLEVHVWAGIAAGLGPTGLACTAYTSLSLGEETLWLGHGWNVVATLLWESHLKETNNKINF